MGFRFPEEPVALARGIDVQALPGFFISDQVAEYIEITDFILSDQHNSSLPFLKIRIKTACRTFTTGRYTIVFKRSKVKNKFHLLATCAEYTCNVRAMYGVYGVWAGLMQYWLISDTGLFLEKLTRIKDLKFPFGDYYNSEPDAYALSVLNVCWRNQRRPLWREKT